MRANWKGFGLGFLAAGLLCGVLAASHLPRGAETGRFAIVISGDRTMIVDSVTGQAWKYTLGANNSGPEQMEFFGAKLKLPPAPKADPAS